MGVVNRALVMNLGGNVNWDWLSLDAVGAAGGILVMWDQSKWEIQDSWVGQYSVSIVLRKVGDVDVVTFSGIYGPPDRMVKGQLWEELTMIRSKWVNPWCLGGDFNEIRRVEERLGCRRTSQNMIDFSDFIAENELIDIPLKGAQFSWSRNSRKSRLDRFLFCPAWISMFPEVCQKVLVHSVSDHCPLLLDPRLDSWGPFPFRFELAWLEIPKLDEMMGGWWAPLKVEEAADFIIGEKLRFVKKRLKEWNSLRLEAIHERKLWLQNRIRVISLADEERLASEDNLNELGKVKEEHKGLLLQEEISWRQKSRVNWLKEGDKNTAYFHNMASARRRNNRIEALEVKGSLSFTKEAITKEIVDYYRSLYSAENIVRPRLDEVVFKSLDANSNSGLERPFSEEEVEKGVFSMNRDKAPGPDGFCLAFFQVCWEYVKGDVMSFFQEFYAGMELDRGTGATFIALVPKVKGAVKVSDFRPISLVGCLYKVLSEVLADRIKIVLPCIISENQCAFVSQRQILDCSLVANEMVDWMAKSGEQEVICKLDMEKAYDRMDWQCLDYFLEMMGFDVKWRGWIRSCLSSACFSILNNGSSKGFFKSSRGLRQVDPLSPFLFVIVAEALSVLLVKGRSEGLVSGVKCNQNGIEGSHLQFADDMLLFSSPQASKILNLKAFLRCYELVTGLRSNFSKSRLYAVNIDEAEASSLANIMGCSLENLPSSYLGLPLGLGRPNKCAWDPIVERIERRLDSWKRNLVSKGGRLTLIKAVLANILICQLSLFKCPMHVVKRIEQIQRRFLWGGSEKKRSLALVSWENICKPVQGGGLSIRRIKQVNQALMGKWLWRFGEEKERLWAKVISGKYGVAPGNWVSLNSLCKPGVTIWRDILCLNSNFDRGVRYRVYSGDRISFWSMRWCSSSPLKVLFLDLFLVADDKSALVKDCYERIAGKVIWKPLFRRNFFDRELPSVLNFFQVLDQNYISLTGVDRRLWVLNSSGCFSVKSFYNSLMSYEENPLAARVWKIKAPPRVCFFGWSALGNKIQTVDFLRKRNMLIIDHCALCIESGESVDHLFIHCKVAREVWGRILERFGMNWVFPSSIKELFEGWPCNPWGKKGKTLWWLSLLALLWVLWIERNNRVFEGKAKSSYFLFIKVIALSISWARALPLFQFVSAFDLWEGWGVVCNSKETINVTSQVWRSPPVGLVKLNFDGSSLGNPGPAGIGGILRDCTGAVIKAFSDPIGIADSSEAEVRAVHQGILSMERNRLGSCIVEGGSLNVIRWLRGPLSPPWRFLHFFDEIKDLSEGLSVLYQHVRRSANAMAGKLAKDGVSKQVLELFDFLPP
ncbi:uncharacterized protein LOC143892304 [Tasmannia lanceolata]|uniref:uncharacterized protein LOC143892304 n=1 Tax=Tasmannia lanceolata TaxID=3420 RepID=UPI0040644488